LKKAKKWGYLNNVPDMDFEREPSRLPTYITEEHFAAIYDVCDQAKAPANIPNVSPAAWWRGLLVMAYLTGWRISDLLGLRRADLNLETGHAITRAEDNKGKRDDRVKLHPIVVEHLKDLGGSFGPLVFPWDLNRRTLHVHFHRLQQAAGIHLPCQEDHKHSDGCFCYGFHDLRRAFATENAGEMSGEALQKLMRHKSYTTTQLYINLSRQLETAVDRLHVPAILRKKPAR
jgi:integrase